jgi:hypothetical protein
MRQAVFAVLAFAVTVVTVAAQIPPPPPPPPPMMPGHAPRDNAEAKTGTAVLKGSVVSAETGKPLRRAQVRAAGTDPRGGRTVSTDENGVWVLSELPAGRYNIQVSKGGYVQLAYGQRRPFEQGKPVDLAEGQVVEKLDVSLPRGSVITGRVFDEFGDPVSGARVSAMRNRFLAGTRRLFPFGGIGASDTTDDIGQFRLHGLSPGDYYVSASFGTAMMFEKSDDRTGYAPTFYPGTPVLGEAQKVPVALGQETQGITFALALTRVVSVSGTVMSSSGKPMANSMVILVNPSMSGGSPMAKTGMTKPDGTFTLSNVEPGDYTLQSQVMDLEAIGRTGSTRGVAVTEIASLPLTIAGKDLTGIQLVTAPTGMATGKVTFSGATAKGLLPSSVSMMAVPATPTTFSLGGGVNVKDDWSFEAAGLSGRRIFRVSLPGWYLRSVTHEGSDITDTGMDFGPGENVTGIEIELTKEMAGLTGTVHGARGEPTSDFVAVAFANDAAKWGHMTRYVRTARPDQSGKFLITGLPAGSYLVVALEYLEPGEEQDPEVLERLRGLGTSVTIKDGEQKSVKLKISSTLD